MKRAFYAALSVLAFLMAYSCSDDSPQEPTPLQAVQIVTVTGTSPATFELERTGDLSPIPISTTQSFTTDLAIGQRIVIAYTAEVADTAQRPMPVHISQAGIIPFDTVRAYSKKFIDKLAPARLSVLSHWRTGPFINFQVLLDWDGQARSFSLIADEATLKADTLDLYLACTGNEPSLNFVERRTYGSFFTGEVFPSPDHPYRIVNLQ